MITKNFTVNLPNFSEARPIAEIVQIASQFESRIYMISQGKKINAKSIMGMMSLGLINNEEMCVEAEGADEEAAVDAIISYLDSLQVTK